MPTGGDENSPQNGDMILICEICEGKYDKFDADFIHDYWLDLVGGFNICFNCDPHPF